MKKIIRKVGDSVGIIFNREEREIFKTIKIGNVIEIPDVVFRKKVKKNV